MRFLAYDGGRGGFERFVDAVVMRGGRVERFALDGEVWLRWEEEEGEAVGERTAVMMVRR